MIWTPQQISQALDINFKSSDSFGKIEFNSKDIQKGDIFIALKGKERDGHEFVSDAFARGAALAIVSQELKNVPASRIVKVRDTFEALQDLAEYKRQNSKAKFIGITGSVGKTSTKEMVSLMLEPFGKTFKSRGNFNNQIGVPLSLAAIADDDEFVIIEMAMRAAGEISFLTKQVMPDIAVLTAVAEGHLEFFESIEKIADAKSEIFTGLDINCGVAILNRDMSTYKRCMENIDIAGIQHIKTFGKSQRAHVRFISYDILREGLVKLRYRTPNEEIEFTMPAIPKHMAANFAAALAVVHSLDLDVNIAVKALASFKPGAGRGKVVKVKKDNKEYSIITDYYNSNPESLKAGLEYLGQFGNVNKIGILGDMRELGQNEVEIHRAAVPYIVKSGIKKLFLVGDIITKIAEDVPKNIVVHIYKNSDELAKEVNQHIEGNEVLLIKGSRGIRLEKVAETLGVEDAL